MSLSGENGFGTTMLVGPTGTPTYPVYGGMCGGSNNSGFGSDGWWIILLLLLAGNGGWGNGGGFGGNALGTDFPWLMNGQQGINNNVSSGFRDSQLNDSITSVRDGISSLSTQLCGCCGDMQMSLANGFNGVAQQLSTNQIADLERSYASQTATTQGMNALQSQLAQCCCDNRMATEGLKYTIATENCQDRYEAAANTREIIQSQNAGFQKILDQMCADKIDAKNEKIADLQNQLNMATLRESQTAQNAFISQGFANEVDQLYNRLSNCPVPSTPVYGRTPIFTCSNNTNNCGCGCGNNF